MSTRKEREKEEFIGRVQSASHAANRKCSKIRSTARRTRESSSPIVVHRSAAATLVSSQARSVHTAHRLPNACGSLFAQNGLLFTCVFVYLFVYPANRSVRISLSDFRLDVESKFLNKLFENFRF